MALENLIRLLATLLWAKPDQCLDYASQNVLSGTSKGKLALHPTVKPVSLIADAIRDCSKPQWALSSDQIPSEQGNLQGISRNQAMKRRLFSEKRLGRRHFCHDSLLKITGKKFSITGKSRALAGKKRSFLRRVEARAA